MEKLSKSEFTILMQRREDIKRTVKERREYQEQSDINDIQRNRADRIYKKARIII
jgi:hypothetical protein